ncbi:MAG: response regulator [Chloroflexota bacterium]|nr:response regulator [Chloroflexota bacterium]
MHVVDDDPLALALLCEVAEDSGWVARGFTSLHDLEDALEQERPRLLILDDDLPDGRGGDLARDLRGDPRTRDVRLLVCTGAHPIRQAEIGAWAPVVSKPFRIEELERYLDAAARREGGSYHRAAG